MVSNTNISDNSIKQVSSISKKQPIKPENAVPQVSVNTNNPTVLPQSHQKKKSFRKVFLLVITGLLILGLGVVGIYNSNTQLEKNEKNNNIIPQKELTPSPIENITNDTPLVEQSLERNPTSVVLTEETPISVHGYTKKQKSLYSGQIEGGSAFSGGPGTPQIIEDYRIRQDKLLKNSEANDSLMVLQALDLNGKILLTIPISVVTGSNTDIPIRSWNEPGSYNSNILLPSGTNSLALKVRNGQELDKVYVEDWKPEVKLISYPKEVGSTDTFNIKLELLPEGKAFSYELTLHNPNDGSSLGSVGGSLAPKRGKITQDVDLNGYPFTATQQWIIEASGYSLFNTSNSESEPIKINLSSEGIPVEISPKEKTNWKNDEEGRLSWGYGFYGYDTTKSLKQMCEEKKRCFELTWTGKGVKFLRSGFKEELDEKHNVITRVTSPDNPDDYYESLISQYRTIKCLFRGNGKQSITLEIKENNKLLGTDTYEFEVNGNSVGPSICMNESYSVNYGLTEKIDGTIE